MASERETIGRLLVDVAAGIRVLATRDGVALTEKQVAERARNIVAGLMGNYRILAHEDDDDEPYVAPPVVRPWPPRDGTRDTGVPSRGARGESRSRAHGPGDEGPRESDVSLAVHPAWSAAQVP